MTQPGIDRAQFLRRMAALGVLTAAGSIAGSPGTGAATGSGRATGPACGLTYRGVCYDTGTEFFPGHLGRERWSRRLMRGEIGAVRDLLHCNSVSVFGSDLGRLAETSAEAAARGLHVWLQPRHFDHPQREVLDHLAETARHAERLRRQHGEVNLNVGCEAMLFTPGIVPGATWPERIEYLSGADPDFAAITRRLDAFLGRAAATARAAFRGGITYAAASFEQVDWRRFDFVGLDHYAPLSDPAAYLRELRRHRRWGKPIVICEFGCCAYEGADSEPGDGWTIVDYSKPIPELTGDPVRSERTQAGYLDGALRVFESEGLHGAYVYSFISPDDPHSPEPRYDLDMASYALVKVLRADFGDPASRYRWEPKQAFATVARHYGAASRR